MGGSSSTEGAVAGSADSKDGSSNNGGGEGGGGGGDGPRNVSTMLPPGRSIGGGSGADGGGGMLGDGATVGCGVEPRVGTPSPEPSLAPPPPGSGVDGVELGGLSGAAVEGCRLAGGGGSVAAGRGTGVAGFASSGASVASLVESAGGEGASVISGCAAWSLSKRSKRRSGNCGERRDLRKQATSASGETAARVKPAQLGIALQALPHTWRFPSTTNSGRLLPMTVWLRSAS